MAKYYNLCILAKQNKTKKSKKKKKKKKKLSYLSYDFHITSGISSDLSLLLDNFQEFVILTFRLTWAEIWAYV